MTQHCHHSKKALDNMGCMAEAVCQENFINKTGQPSFRTPALEPQHPKHSPQPSVAASPGSWHGPTAASWAVC